MGLPKLLIILVLCVLSSISFLTCSFGQTRVHNFGIVCNPRLSGADEWEHPDKMIQIYRNLGVETIIVHFSWQAIEPQKGRHSQEALSLYDDIVKRLSQADIEINAMLVRTPQWAVNLSVTGARKKGMQIFAPPPKDPEYFADFAKFIAKRYKGKIKSYLFYNETNLSKRWIAPEYLVKIQKAGYEAIKSVDLSIQIALPSLEGRIRQRCQYLEQFLMNGGGKYTDIYDFHMNSAALISSKIQKETQALQAILRKYREDKKIVQYGAFAVPSLYTYTKKQIDFLRNLEAIPADYSQRTPETQARVLVTQMVLGLSLGIQKIFWGRTRDWKTDPESIAKHRRARLERLPPDSFYGMNKKEGHDMTMGIINNDYSPKPSFYALKTLIAKLDGAEFVKRLDSGKGNAIFFRKSKKLIGVIWNPAGEKDIALKVDAEKVTLVNMYGETIKTVNSNEGAVNIRIGPSPIYMEGAHKVDRI